MKNQPNKATVKDGLPTPKELPIPKPVGNFIIGKADKVGIDGHYYHYQTVCRMLQEYSDQQNAELREAINLCRKSICDEQTINRGLREKISALQTENKDLFLKIKELEFGETVDNDCIESQSNEIDELKAWKESAMRELNELDLQSLGAKLGIGLGQSVSENIHAKVDGLLERVKELEAGNNRILNEVNEINKLTKQTRANVTMRIIELETKNDRLYEALKKIADRFDPETQDFEGIIRIAEEALKQQEK